MWILLGQHLRKIGLLFTPTTGRTESVSLSTSSHNQCDQIGRFLEFIAKKIVTKVAQMFGDFLGNSENHCFLCQTDRATFGKTWATFYFTIWSHCSLTLIRSFLLFYVTPFLGRKHQCDQMLKYKVARNFPKVAQK